MVAFVFILYSYDGHAIVSIVGSQAEKVDRGVVLILRPCSCAYAEEDIREDTGEENSSDAK